MTCAVLAFAAGVVLLQMQPALPPLAWALALVPLTALGLKYRRLIPIATFGAGFFWAAYCAELRMGEWLPRELGGRAVGGVGGGAGPPAAGGRGGRVVWGLPAQGERGVRFEFELESAARGERVPSRVLLWWYRSMQPSS